MNKFVIIIVILLTVISRMFGINFTDPSLKKDLKEWELVKTVIKPDLVKVQNYQLITNTNPYKLTLKDEKGNVLWSKQNLRSESDWFFFKNDEKGKAIKDYSKIPNGYKISSESAREIVGYDGNCLLMDEAYNRYVFVDKQGAEVYLPQNSASMEYIGLFSDKYLMFRQLDSLDFAVMNKEAEFYIPVYPPYNISTKYSNVKNWCVIFNKNGSVAKQFKLPDVGWPTHIYFDDNLNHLAYNWERPDTETQGYVLMLTTGEVIKVGEYLPLMTPVFSEDDKLWIPNTQTQDIIILGIKTGKRVFILEGPWPNGSAISDEDTGYLFYTDMGYAILLDYKNLKKIFYQYEENARFSDPWISGDGKEIRFSYQEKDKPAEIRFYRMK